MSRHEDYRNPGEREAERLRIIMQTILDGMPDMPVSVAIPMIFETEKKTRDLEEVQARVNVKATTELPDTSPATVANFVSASKNILDFLPDKKIQAIKELRGSATYGGVALGLKESKDGVEEYLARAKRPKPVHHVTAPTGWSVSLLHDIAQWIDMPSQDDIRDLHFDGKKIQAIKEIRGRYGAGLKDAKDGYEFWAAGKHLTF